MIRFPSYAWNSRPKTARTVRNQKEGVSVKEKAHTENQVKIVFDEQGKDLREILEQMIQTADLQAMDGEGKRS